MGKLFRLAIALTALNIAAFAQQQPTTGTITTATPGVGNCVSYRAENNSTVGIIVSGTWTGTLTPSLNIFPARAINKKVLPVDGSTAQSTITSAGGGGNFGFVANIGGFAQFQICATSFSSGTAVVDLFATPAPNNSTIAAGGGGGSGTVTNVATTGPISGGPITTTGTISCPTCMVAPSGTKGQSIGNNNGSTGYAATSAFGTSLDTYGIIFSTGATAPTVDQTLAVNNMIAAVCPAVGSGAGCEIDMPANSRVLIHGTAGAQVGIPILTDGVKFRCAGGPGPGYNAAAQHLDGPASCTFETDRPGLYIFGAGEYGGNETGPSAGPQFENITFVDQTANGNAGGGLFNVNTNGTTLDNPVFIGGFRQTAIAAPSAPTCTVSNTGGTITGGSYQVEIAAWTTSGPSLPSAPTTCTGSPISGANTGSASITIPSPVAPIIGYEVYAAGAGSSTFVTVSPLPTYTTNADGSITINLQKTTPLSVTTNSTSTRGPVAIDLSHSCAINLEGDLGWLGALNFSNQDRIRNLKAHMVQSAVCEGPAVATPVIENPEFSTCDASASTGACASGSGGVATPGILIGFGTMSVMNPHETGFIGANASTGNSIAFTGFNNTVTAGTIQGGTGNTATGINMINAKRTMILGTAVQNYAVGVSADANSTNNFSWFSDNGTNSILYNDLGAPGTNNQWFPSGRNAIFSQSNVANGASINLPPGVAPTTTIANGDMWTTSTGLFARINGATVGPFLGMGGSTTQLLYNNAGAIGSTSGWTTNGTTTISGATNAILNWNADTAFSRDSAGVVDVGTGAAGSTAGTLQATKVATVGTNGGISGTEGTGANAGTPAAGTDILYPDSTLHNWHLNINNVDKGGIAALGGTNTGAAGMTLNMSASTTVPSVQLPAVVGGSILAGTSTAALSAPFVIQNTNSTNNNTSIPLIVSSPGTSTGQIGFMVNGAATGSDLADFVTGGTVTNGVISGQTTKAAVKNSGAIALGAANCVTFGTAGAICAAEGTAPTNVASTAAVYPDSTAHELEAATNGSTSFGILNRSVPAAANETGKVATDSAKAICTASAGGCNVAGQYVVNLNVWGSGTACSSVTAGSVVFTMTWVDEQGTTHAAVPMAPFYDYKTAATNATGTFSFNTALTTEGANVTMPIGINGSAAPTVTATYTACTTGTGTYNFRATMTRLQ